jgi:hypothetical protein
LLVPGLTGAGWQVRPERLHDGLDPGAIARLLARADRVGFGAEGLEHALRRSFGYAHGPPEDPATDFPVAALTLFNDSGRRPDGYWLRADPVHIEAGQDRLIMTGGAGLAVRGDEAGALCAAINEHMAEAGIRLIAPVPERWYFRWREPPEICFAPLPDVIGDDLFHHMPGGKAGRRWRAWLNEIQMLLHAHPVNRRRREQRRIEISGVWIWGGGALPPARDCDYAAIWSDDPLARGLALNAGLAPAGVPANAADWLERAGPGSHWMLIDSLEESLRLGALESWRERLAALQRDWLTPLADAVRGGGIGKLVISASTGTEYHVTRMTMRRWWRRGRPLTEYN